MTYDIKIDEQNRIVTPNGGNWFADTTVGNWVFGVEYAGDFNPYWEDGHYLYKYESGQVLERTDEEKETDDPVPPTPAEQLRSDVDYCLMMLGEDES